MTRRFPPSKQQREAALEFVGLLFGKVSDRPELARLSVRFWMKVRRGAPDDCWPWIGARSSWGYGNFRIGDRMLRAHRVAYALTHGTIPDEMNILHRCDNRACCNPRHLYSGDQSDNNHDAWQRSRRRDDGRPDASEFLKPARRLSLFDP